MPREIGRIGALALALMFLGCGADELARLGSGAQLLTGIPMPGGAILASGEAGCYTNSAAGPLVVDPTYGTAIIDSDTGSSGPTPVMWRPGFTAHRAGSEIVVMDPDGNVVATTGRRYRIAGGYVTVHLAGPQPEIRVFWTCDFVIPQP
jgi:hypothetical protein